MSLVINSNTMANTVSRNLNKHYNALSDSTRKLSSGLRVERAADDAAGLAVRELMRADITALQQGVRNANDAISLLQTADGALQTIDEKLIRMKELAEQAATGTYDSVQRSIIDSEYQSMASEITRIAKATDFSNVHLLDGSLGSEQHDGSKMQSTGKLKIHFGAGNDSNEDYYYIRIDSSTASSLGVGNSAKAGSDGFAISTQEAAGKAINAINKAIVSKDTIRASLGSMQNRLEATVANLTIQAENLQSAESRISDVDVASEMTRFVRNQVLANTAVSMLGQANTIPQMALSLL